MEAETIITEDGAELNVGAGAFNYYDMKPGVIGKPDSAGWFDFYHTDGTVGYLNGERICSWEFAKGKGWIK